MSSSEPSGVHAFVLQTQVERGLSVWDTILLLLITFLFMLVSGLLCCKLAHQYL